MESGCVRQTFTKRRNAGGDVAVPLPPAETTGVPVVFVANAVTEYVCEAAEGVNLISP
jgi:hypothetical protein